MNLLRKLLGKETEMEYLLSHGMKVGKNCHIYSDSTIDHTYPHLITIGDDVTISTNVTILVHDASTNVVGEGTKLGRVSIGNNVFIGTGTIILCNTHIGNNVVVGAGSIVTHDLPDDAVYAGSPAKKFARSRNTVKRFTNCAENGQILAKFVPGINGPMRANRIDKRCTMR